MNCPKCENVMNLVHGQTHFHCESCHEFGFPTEIQQSSDGIQPTGKETPFLCPNCPEDQHLQVGLIAGSQVCFCTKCRGFVVDRSSLGDLIEAMRAAYNGPDDRPSMLNQIELHQRCCCPACSEVMETFPYCGPGNVVLDTCESCKLTWLNHGEFGAIVRAPGKRDYAFQSGESDRLRSQFYASSDDRIPSFLDLL